jgi:hypothetical protein
MPAERPAMVSTSAGEKRAWLSVMCETEVLMLTWWRGRRVHYDEVDAQKIIVEPRLGLVTQATERNMSNTHLK